MADSNRIMFNAVTGRFVKESVEQHIKRLAKLAA